MLDPLEGERNIINNSRTRVVDVPATRRSILYVEGEPRWEYKFVRRAAERDRALRVASVVRTTPNKYYRQGVDSAAELVEGFPVSAAELFAYDAVVIGSYEAASPAARAASIAEGVRRSARRFGADARGSSRTRRRRLAERGARADAAGAARRAPGHGPRAAARCARSRRSMACSRRSCASTPTRSATRTAGRACRSSPTTRPSAG